MGSITCSAAKNSWTKPGKPDTGPFTEGGFDSVFSIRKTPASQPSFGGIVPGQRAECRSASLPGFVQDLGNA